MSEKKSTLETLENEWREVKQVYDKYHEETKSGIENLSAETKERLEKADNALDKLEAKFQEFETRQAMAFGSSAKEVDAKSVINDYLRNAGHGASFTPEDIKSLSPDSGPDGGFALLDQARSMIIEKIQEISPVRQVAEIVTLGEGDTYVMLRENTDPALNNVGPRTSITETSAGDYDKVSVYVHEQAAFPLVARQQIEDQSWDLVANLQNRLAREFAQDEGTQFMAGTGVNEAFGILTNSSISVVDSGSNTAFDFDDLTDLQSELKIGYNPTWGFNRKTRGYIRKLKGNDNYFWEADMAAGSPNSLLGDPYIIVPDLVAPVSNAYSANDKPIIYGDWAEGYVIVDKLGFTIDVDMYTNKPFVGYYTRRRVGGDVKQPEAFKILRTTT